jgi:hypothetical protein
MRRFAVLVLAAVSVFPQAVPRLTMAAATNGPAQVNAPTTPLTAKKTRVTYSIGSAGGFRIKVEERGTFARSSAGDEATHLKVIRDGQSAAGSSVISQRKEGVRYLIDDANRRYTLVPWIPSPTNEADRESTLPTPDTPTVTRTIGGIKCVAVPVQDSAGKIIGKNWMSPDHGITVRSEMDVMNPQTGATIGLVVEELTDIHIGVEPDPGEFTIPPGYKQTRGDVRP